MTQTMNETQAMAIFEILVNELPGEDPKRTTGKVKRKLRRAGLGPYDDGQFERVRALHDALKEEISKHERSKYYRGTPGGFAAAQHFDVETMVRDYRETHPWITEEDLGRIVSFAVYVYYLR
jgi:hypothetical protein